jgi:protein-tyrosine phosphatase
MTSKLFWIPGPWKGKLVIVPRPRGGDWLPDEIAGWQRAGISVVISLLETDEVNQLELAAEKDTVESNGLRFISFPIPDRGIPGSTQRTVVLLSDLASLLESRKSVAIHCRQNVGRAGLIASGLLLAAGSTPEQAIAAVSTARGVTIPETPAQLEWIKHLPVHQVAQPVPR